MYILNTSLHGILPKHMHIALSQTDNVCACVCINM